MVMKFDGDEIESVYTDLVSLEVELDDELASMFRLRVHIVQASGEWSNLDEERLRIWTPISIAAGFEDNNEELMTGYITHMKPFFGQNPEDAYLDIWGMDASVLMDRVEVLKDWPNKKDSDIATEIFQQYGLSPDVEDTSFVHDEVQSTIIQRETDMQFLKRLALRNGFECYVQGATGYFKSPAVDEESQPVLAVHYGEETNLHGFSVNVNGLTPASIGMHQIDRMNKEVLNAEVDDADLAALGSMGASDFMAAGMEPGKMFIGSNGAVASEEMESMCRGLYRQAQWFVNAQGEVNANHYEHILMPRKPVTIKGAGETYSGLYYVNHVTHVFTSEGYIQRLKARRNALMTTGDEDFSGSGGFF